MRNPKLTKEGKLPRIGQTDKSLRMAFDIEELFLERLPNHTLREVCLYIAGYVYRQQKLHAAPEPEVQTETR